MKKQIQAKPKVIGTFTFYDYSDVFIDYYIKTNKYKCSQITKMVGLKPKVSHDKGDKFTTRRRNPETKKIEMVERVWPNGLWIFSTKNIIKKKRFENHAQHLLRRLQKNKKYIKKFLKEGVQIDIYVNLQIDTKADFFGLGAKSQLFQELLEYCNYFEWMGEDSKESFRKT